MDVGRSNISVMAGVMMMMMAMIVVIMRMSMLVVQQPSAGEIY
jgi:hypothetical protein